MQGWVLFIQIKTFIALSFSKITVWQWILIHIVYLDLFWVKDWIAEILFQQVLGIAFCFLFLL